VGRKKPKPLFVSAPEENRYNQYDTTTISILSIGHITRCQAIDQSLNPAFLGAFHMKYDSGFT
jgi:hypothetical protein